MTVRDSFYNKAGEKSRRPENEDSVERVSGKCNLEMSPSSVTRCLVYSSGLKYPHSTILSQEEKGPLFRFPTENRLAI